MLRVYVLSSFPLFFFYSCLFSPIIFPRSFEVVWSLGVLRYPGKKTTLVHCCSFISKFTP
ncbi:hypothetical protein ASPWEDRAFT_685759 [Aspergillus wentii DTO 134E9]|uniref:Uncharacterized protein n=1 Tax=Aspergillus wentii DTO 134E9 TaxID=1073089 RepID=A0A1L9R8F7_ASPWE|nr:uncharacterized protein ASPWEDRAFT_685759 [Aspergillus wentii DTO 134E9]OJJ31184.1 hypothetical protein ASPWEDRAFT_685759 [Aspergillus wentii DTO 134E9]